MKFTIILLIFASSTFCQTFERNPIENQRFLDTLKGLSAVMNQLLESVKTALSGLVIQTQNWIENQLNEIGKVIANGLLAFNQYIQQMESELEALVNGQIKPCLVGLPEKIKDVQKKTKEAVEVCQNNGWTNFQTIKQDILDYRKTNQEQIQYMANFINSCVNEHNFVDKIKCALQAAQNVSQTVGALRENIASTTYIVATKIQTTVSITYQCIESQLRLGQEQIEGILEEARQCLKDGPSTESPTTAPTEPSTSAPTEPPTNGNDHIQGQSFKIFL